MNRKGGSLSESHSWDVVILLTVQQLTIYHKLVHPCMRTVWAINIRRSFYSAASGRVITPRCRHIGGNWAPGWRIHKPSNSAHYILTEFMGWFFCAIFILFSNGLAHSKVLLIDDKRQALSIHTFGLRGLVT